MYIKSFKDKRYKNDTTLSSYLWDLKENHSQILKLTFTMGSYDGAEVCELLGIFLFYQNWKTLAKRTQVSLP